MIVVNTRCDCCAEIAAVDGVLRKNGSLGIAAIGLALLWNQTEVGSAAARELASPHQSAVLSLTANVDAGQAANVNGSLHPRAVFPRRSSTRRSASGAPRRSPRSSATVEPDKESSRSAVRDSPAGTWR